LATRNGYFVYLGLHVCGAVFVGVDHGQGDHIIGFFWEYEEWGLVGSEVGSLKEFKKNLIGILRGIS
jgi:hypothetical protein